MNGTLLAFDVGARRIGVAVGHPLAGARPLTVLAAEPEPALWAAVAALLAEHRPECCVVGLPLLLDGGEQAITVRARLFAQRLRASVAKVALVDERHSSQEAAAHFREARQQGRLRRKDAGRLDALAAVVIAERFLAGEGGSR